jgi:hypothetical protein
MPASVSWCSTILRPVSVAQGDLLVIGDAGNQPLVATLIAKHRVDAIIHRRSVSSAPTIRRRTAPISRDYKHVSDLIAAHCDALSYLRDGGASTFARGAAPHVGRAKAHPSEG